MVTCHHHQTVLTPNAYHRHHLIAAGLMVIGHLLHLKVCALAVRHLPHPTGRVVLPISRTICAASILHRKMIWMTTA
jgi:hypothetical protein